LESKDSKFDRFERSRFLKQQIRVAVVGAGYWGTKLSREYAGIETSSGDTSLAWVVDASPSAVERIRAELKSKTKYGSDYRQVLLEDIDAVHIALPNSLHFEVAQAALKAGKHVLLEKPMAMTSREAFKLVSLAEQKGLVLQVGHIFRFNNAVRMVRKLIDERAVGKVFYNKVEWAATIKPPAGTDIVFDLAPHPIDILNFLLDEWPSSVDAVGESYVRGGDQAEEMAFVNLEFPDKVLANVYVSWIQHGVKERSIRVVGQKGTLYCDALNQTVTISNDKGVVEVPRSEFPSSRPKGRNEQDKAEGGKPNNTIRDMQYNFLESMRGRGPQFNSGFVGARTVAVLEAITKVMRQKRQQSQLSFAVPRQEA
jgi:UDP-N-acetylglucosamine 3-dehydrogenase